MIPFSPIPICGVPAAGAPAAVGWIDRMGTRLPLQSVRASRGRASRTIQRRTPSMIC